VQNFTSLADSLHLESGELPPFAIKEPMRSRRFLLKRDQQLSGEVLTTFVEDFIEGKLKQTIRSEPVPEMQQGPVMAVVDYTYDDLVIDNEKDVLLDYYTQWCGPCKAMAPNYEQLAYLYASDATARDQVTIAKIDAEANDVPGDIRGFPTFKLFPAGPKELPVLYDGPWTIEGFADLSGTMANTRGNLLPKNKTRDSAILHMEQAEENLG